MKDNKLIPPPHIVLAHWEEWIKGSGVSARITSLNVKSLSLPEEIDELLNRNTKSRWKHWEYGAGWAVMGVDPSTGEEVYNGAQFKPDTPVHRHEDGVPKFKRDGSPDYQKYFSASGVESEPLFLQMEDREYWLKVKADITKRIILAEGAKKAGSALTAGETCISIAGVANGQRKGRLKKQLEEFCTGGRTIVLGFDSDMFHNPNVCKALDKLGCLLKTRGVLVHVLMLPRATKGIDDFIVAYGHEAFKQLVDNALTFEEWRDEFIVHPQKEVKTTDPNAPDADENYQLKAQAALFSDRPWVSIDGKLHSWTGNHYELQDEAEVKAMISRWCSAIAVPTGNGWTRTYATATHIDNIYAWVQRRFAVAPSKVNPPGLNCLNGVVKVSWQGKQPSYELVQHDPSVVYTYVGEFEFDPNANPETCDRLLQCLEAPQREILIRTLAASLDLAMVRKFRSRVKALLCKGDGNNGKDSIREAVDLLYGIGVTGCTFSDFQQYDEGRKFPIAKLAQSRVNWSSENSDLQSLDRLQCLKKAISGEDLDFELKGGNDRPMKPNCVFFFNINSIPNLRASMEAIKSRYAVLLFDRTFKVGADPAKGELEADPRFRYDPEFIKKEVVPSLLNKMLAALPEVAMNGIDYSCTDGALQEIREESTHLARFARDVGLDYQIGGRVSGGELWEVLRKWYVDNGYLEIEKDAKGKEKLNWLDSGSRQDRLVTSSNKVISRFLELFPQAKRFTDNSRATGHPGRAYIQGIGFVGQVSDAQKFLCESISSKIDYLTVEECQLLISKLNSRISTESKAQQTQHSQYTVDPCLITDSALGSSLPQQQGNTTSSVSDSSSAVTESSTPNGVLASNLAARDVTVDNSKNFAPPPIDFKVGDRVLIDCPGLTGVHGKVGTIKRFKLWQEKLPLAEVQIPGRKKRDDAQLTWLRPAPPEEPEDNN